ncbi:hypothetical protein D3C80_2023400 [compost metagenome]
MVPLLQLSQLSQLLQPLRSFDKRISMDMLHSKNCSLTCWTMIWRKCLYLKNCSVETLVCGTILLQSQLAS